MKIIINCIHIFYFCEIIFIFNDSFWFNILFFNNNFSNFIFIIK